MLKKLLNRKKRKQLKTLINQPLTYRELSLPIKNIEEIPAYLELQNCQVINGTRFVISQNEKLFFTSGNLPSCNLQEALRKWILCEEDLNSCSFNQESKEINLKVSKAEKFLTGTSIYASNYEPNNIYHFLMDCIFDAILAHEKGIKIDNFIINPTLLPRFRHLLTLLYPQAKLIYALPGEIVTAQNLILFGQRNMQWHWLRQRAEDGQRVSEGRHFLNPTYLHKLQKFLLNAVEIKPALKKNSKKVITFLPRKSRFRNTLNQEAIIQFLKDKCQNHELKIADPLQLSFQELGEILSNTDLLFCQEGAALMNVIFANNNKMQIVTWPKFDSKNQDSLYQEIAEILGHQFLSLPALSLKSENLSKDNTGQLDSESQRDLLVSIHLIDEILMEFLSSD